MRQMLLVLLVLGVGCADEEEKTFDRAREAGEAAGFAEGQRQGYAIGLEEGREAGFAAGRRDGRARALMSWGPVGLGIGVLIGLGGLLLLRREALAEAARARRRDASIRAALGRLPEGLSAADRERLAALAGRRLGLEAALGRAEGPDAEGLRRRLSPQLDRLNAATLELARLVARLRSAVAETTDAASLEARLADRRAQLEEADPALRESLSAVILAEERALAARRRAETDLQACTLRFDALEGFLDHARVSLVNLQVDDRAPLEAELGHELETLEATVRATRAELAEI